MVLPEKDLPTVRTYLPLPPLFPYLLLSPLLFLLLHPFSLSILSFPCRSLLEVTGPWAAVEVTGEP